MSGRYLLDSHILIWLDSGNSRLTKPVLEKLRYAEHRYLSAATAWELSLKQAAGKLQLGVSVSSMLAIFRLDELPVRIAHGDRAAALPRHHGDPFDRMLIAQARMERLTLVTVDDRIAKYEVDLLPMH